MVANLIHLSEIKIAIKDQSTANYDAIMKRPKGALPTSSIVTLWGQRQMVKQQDRNPKAQGDIPTTDGYVYFEKPMTVTLKKGDEIVEVDGRVFKAKIVEVRDETVYYNGADWVRADFLRVADVA